MKYTSVLRFYGLSCCQQPLQYITIHLYIHQHRVRHPIKWQSAKPADDLANQSVFCLSEL